MNAFGLGTRLGLDLPSEDKGVFLILLNTINYIVVNGILAPTLHWALGKIE
jgi:hypothetical protein